MEVAKRFYWNEARNCITIGAYTWPAVGFSIELGSEEVSFRVRCFITLYISLSFRWLNSLIYRHKLYDRELEFEVGFHHGMTASVSLFSDTMGWKKSDWKWYWNIGDKLKGKYEVSKKIVEERDILVPMPEKAYPAHAILADWTWKYPRWKSQTIRRCEINIPGGIPFAGKGENSWDCGDDAVFGTTTGKVRNIPEAVGGLVGSILADRVKNGGWSDYDFKRPKEKIQVVPSPRIDYCSQCGKEHGFDCPLDKVAPDTNDASQFPAEGSDMLR